MRQAPGKGEAATVCTCRELPVSANELRHASCTRECVLVFHIEPSQLRQCVRPLCLHIIRLDCKEGESDGMPPALAISLRGLVTTREVRECSAECTVRPCSCRPAARAGRYPTAHHHALHVGIRGLQHINVG